jgi:hypothetical protein
VVFDLRPFLRPLSKEGNRGVKQRLDNEFNNHNNNNNNNNNIDMNLLTRFSNYVPGLT